MRGIKTSVNKSFKWYENKRRRNEYYMNNKDKLFPRVDCPSGRVFINII